MTDKYPYNMKAHRGGYAVFDLGMKPASAFERTSLTRKEHLTLILPVQDSYNTGLASVSELPLYSGATYTIIDEDGTQST